MTSKIQIYLISFILISLSVGIIIYKVNVLGFPMFSGEKKSVWSIEAKISFKGLKKNAFISLALPKKQKGMYFYNENASSPNYGYTKAEVDGYTRGEWAKRNAKGKQTLYFSIDVVVDDKFDIEDDVVIEKTDEMEDNEEAVIQAANSIMKEVYQFSANDLTMASELVSQFNKTDDSQSVKMIKRKYIHSVNDLRDIIILLLKNKGVKIRRIGALELIDGKNNASLKPMFEVFYNDKWELFDIKEGRVDKSKNLFIWQRGSVSLLDAEGVKNSKVKFSVTEHIVPAKNVALLRNEKENPSSFVDYSLFILPNESQNTFKHLLLIPIGAFVVVLLRIFVGLKTSGTFMPILLSMAFMQTELVPGITMFLLVVFLGLVIRSYLSHLNLLLVARISSVLIIVVIIISMVTVITYKLGLKDAVTITFFPMIILAWTIERMSIIWEEEGSKEVFKQGGGSLLVSILAYFAMTNSFVQFLTFNFPEFLIALLGIIILVGRYSGYRLSELHRFASLANKA